LFARGAKCGRIYGGKHLGLLGGVTDRDARKRTRYELRLPRWRENTGLCRAEGRTRLIPREGTETLAPEVAVVAGGG